jgi:hypothetical protein
VNDLFVHLLLFLLASVAIVGMGTCYADAEDGPALRNFRAGSWCSWAAAACSRW